MKVRAQVIEKLRVDGVKVTPQRVAIIDYLEKHHIHPSADDIYKSLKKEFPAMSLATIYNTLEKLEEIKALIKLKIADGQFNYEYNLDPHDHFYCNKCHKIYDIANPLIDFSKKNIEGHKVDKCHVYYEGVCKNCKKIKEEKR